jgi:hypothetical protein
MAIFILGRVGIAPAAMEGRRSETAKKAKPRLSTEGGLASLQKYFSSMR